MLYLAVALWTGLITPQRGRWAGPPALAGRTSPFDHQTWAALRSSAWLAAYPSPTAVKHSHNEHQATGSRQQFILLFTNSMLCASEADGVCELVCLDNCDI